MISLRCLTAPTDSYRCTPVFQFPKSLQGWFRTLDLDDRAILRRRNRSFTVPRLKRPIEHLYRSLGRRRRACCISGNTGKAVDDQVCSTELAWPSSAT